MKPGGGRRQSDCSSFSPNCRQFPHLARFVRATILMTTAKGAPKHGCTGYGCTPST